MNRWQEDEDVLVEDEVYLGSSLIVLNDDYTTFETVINAFIDILKHSSEQAEQCAWIIHTKGGCTVKHGTYEELSPYKDALTDRGLDAIIENP